MKASTLYIILVTKIYVILYASTRSKTTSLSPLDKSQKSATRITTTWPMKNPAVTLSPHHFLTLDTQNNNALS